MTRGKYAAKAAGQRAAAAAETVETLKAHLAEERACRARETADLKNQVQQLSGKLTSSVNDLSAQAIADAMRHAQDKVHAAESAAEARGVAVLKALSGHGAKLTSEAWQEVYAALGIHPADVEAGVYALGTDEQSRASRRVGRKELMGNVKVADAKRDRAILASAMAAKIGAEARADS